jgi:hypothetical protein
MENNFDLRKFLAENKVNETEENNGGFEAFKNTVRGILKDEGVDVIDFEDIVTIEGLIEFWAQEAETNFYNHTKEDMVTLSKEAGLDFGDQEALFNTDEVNSLERGGIEDDELDEGYEFPITTIEQLRKFYKEDYFQVVGQNDDRNIDDVASGADAEDMEEQMFAQEIIKGMKLGKFLDKKSSSKYIAKIADKYYGG